VHDRVTLARRLLATCTAALLLTCGHQAPPEVAPGGGAPQAEAARPAAPVVAAPSPAVPPAAPEPEPGGGVEPEIAIGLVVGATDLTVSSEAPVTVTDTMGTVIPGVPPAQAWAVVPEGAGLVLVSPDGWRSQRRTEFRLAPTSPATSLTVGQHSYRGRLLLRRDNRGLTVINQLGVESYLAGVLSAEMGRRDSSDLEAVRAQAVISRTFALKNRGKRRQDGFDLNATVADQVYGGVTTETPLAWQAVRGTTGQVLTWQGGLIDAFFSSTCGGRTAEGTEVYAGADRPYLQSVADVDANGQAYCRVSPRFRWQEEWTGDSLRGILRRTLPVTAGVAPASVTRVVDVRVTSRTVSDRAGRVEINLGDRVLAVSGPDIRLTLRPSPGQVLRSSAFTLTESRSGGQVDRLVADGRGSGHGVGFCQWGAVGRARAGQDYRTILRAYFTGTDIQRLY